MGRLQKKKDPVKKKKKTADDPASGNAVARQNKNGVAAKAIAGVSARLKPRPGAAPAKSAGQRTTVGVRGYVNQAVQFLKEVQVELKKVYWPSRKQAAGSTVVVIVLVILVSIFLGIADFGLSNIMKLILG